MINADTDKILFLISLCIIHHFVFLVENKIKSENWKRLWARIYICKERMKSIVEN